MKMRLGLLFLITVSCASVLAGWKGGGGGNGYVCFQEKDNYGVTGKSIVNGIRQKLLAQNSSSINGIVQFLDLNRIKASIAFIDVLEMALMHQKARAAQSTFEEYYFLPAELDSNSPRRLFEELEVVFRTIEKRIEEIGQTDDRLKNLAGKWLHSMGLIRESISSGLLVGNSYASSNKAKFLYVRDVKNYPKLKFAGVENCIDVTLVVQNLFSGLNGEPVLEILTDFNMLHNYMSLRGRFLLWLHEVILLTERTQLNRHETEKVREIVMTLLRRDLSGSDLVNSLKDLGYGNLLNSK